MEKKIVYLGLEFLFWPLQKFYQNKKGTLITGIDSIDNMN